MCDKPLSEQIASQADGIERDTVHALPPWRGWEGALMLWRAAALVVRMAEQFKRHQDELNQARRLRDLTLAEFARLKDELDKTRARLVCPGPMRIHYCPNCDQSL